MCYTVQFILKNIQDKLKIGDLDSSLDILMQTCLLELFSTNVSEEKETKKILAKTFEAKVTSSYNTLEILGKNISSSYLLNLVQPFKQKLEDFNSEKLLRKVEESLRRVQLGILSNTSLNTEVLMMFSYGLVNEFFDKNLRMKTPNGHYETEKKTLQEASCLLIPIEPKRGSVAPKIVIRTNQHIIAEFSLQVFFKSKLDHILLRLLIFLLKFYFFRF